MVSTPAIAPIYPRTQASLEQSGGLLDPIVDDGFASKSQDATFGDLVDILNPLQHLPVVSAIYRAVSGDEIKPAARAIGSLMYGGPLSMISTGVELLVQEAMGTTPEKMIAEKLGGGETRTAAAPQSAPPGPAASGSAAISGRAAERVLEQTGPATRSRGAWQVQDAAALKALARDLRGVAPTAMAPHAPGPAPRSAEQLVAGTEKPDQRPVIDRRRHPNLPPGKPSPEWVANAMQQALTKYQQAARTPSAVGPVASPALGHGAVPMLRR